MDIDCMVCISFYILLPVEHSPWLYTLQFMKSAVSLWLCAHQEAAKTYLLYLPAAAGADMPGYPELLQMCGLHLQQALPDIHLITATAQALQGMIAGVKVSRPDTCF